MKHLIGIATLVVVLASWPTLAGAKDLSQKSGQELYERLCAGCHGAQGEGDGVVAAYFKMQPPDLTRLASDNAGQFPADELRRIIDGTAGPGPHGSRQMPIWGVALQYTDAKSVRDEEQVKQMIDRLVEHLRSIQKKPTSEATP
jgi:mono/diheme cytochrome c family protein